MHWNIGAAIARVCQMLCLRASVERGYEHSHKLQMQPSQVLLSSVPPNGHPQEISVLPRNFAHACPSAGGCGLHHISSNFSSWLPQHPCIRNSVIQAYEIPSSTPGQHEHPQVIWRYGNLKTGATVKGFRLLFSPNSFCMSIQGESSYWCHWPKLHTQFFVHVCHMSTKALCLTVPSTFKALGTHTYRIKKRFISSLGARSIPFGCDAYQKKKHKGTWRMPSANEHAGVRSHRAFP